MKNKQKGWLYTLNWEPIKRYTPGDMKNDFTGINYSVNGIFYRLNGLRHREDGPAIVFSDNDVANQYWLFGKIIRDVPSDEAFKLYVSMLKLKGLL